VAVKLIRSDLANNHAVIEEVVSRSKCRIFQDLRRAIVNSSLTGSVLVSGPDGVRSKRAYFVVGEGVGLSAERKCPVFGHHSASPKRFGAFYRGRNQRRCTFLGFTEGGFTGGLL